MYSDMAAFAKPAVRKARPGYRLNFWKNLNITVAHIKSDSAIKYAGFIIHLKPQN